MYHSPTQTLNPLAHPLPLTEVDPELEDLVEAANHARAMGTGFAQWKSLFSPLYRPQLVTIIAMAAFNQLDGINTIMFYVSVAVCSACCVQGF